MPSEPKFRVLTLEMEAAISPAEAELMAQATAAAAEDDYDLLLVRLDTPGGTVEATRGILKAILNSTVPVAVWVGPAGARAASAGVFIVAAGHIAAMAPQTTIGAATPVGMGGEDVPETMARKAINDIKSMVRGMAQAHGRNVDWYMRAVEESDSITAQEALQLKVIDILASTPEQLMEAIGSGQKTLPGWESGFSAEEYVIEEFAPGWRYRLLAWLLNPQVAYFLLLGGMAGLFFEFVSPGTFFPGVVGGICLLLALYALSILSTNVAGILLLLLGLVFFFLELAFISHGLLSIAGILALFIGSAILFPAGPGEPGLPFATIVVTVGGVATILGFGVYLAAKAQIAKPASGREGLEGSIATVRHWRGIRGQVFAHGELWSARTADGSALNVGDTVRIQRVDGLMLTVERVEVSAGGARLD
ncbi:MAG: nodulation protein NfeD [Desulfocurvibacter africanus]